MTWIELKLKLNILDQSHTGPFHLHYKQEEKNGNNNSDFISICVVQCTSQLLLAVYRTMVMIMMCSSVFAETNFKGVCLEPEV